MSNPPNASRKRAGKLPLKSINLDLAADYNLTECRLPSPSHECISTIPTGATSPVHLAYPWGEEMMSLEAVLKQQRREGREGAQEQQIHVQGAF